MKLTLPCGCLRETVFLLTAIWLSIAPQRATAQNKPLQLNVAVASAYVAFAPYWLALADNMLEKKNLKVNVTLDALNTGSAMPDRPTSS